MLKRTDPIEKLELSVRAYCCLKYVKTNQIKDLEGKSLEYFRNIPNFGFKSFRELLIKWVRIEGHKVSYLGKILSDTENYQAEMNYYGKYFPETEQLKLVW